MPGKLQFSLGYLLLETFWIALAIGFTRYIVVMSRFELWHDEKVVMVLCYLGDILVIPTALGGLAGNMKAGAKCALGILLAIVLWFLLCVPAVE
jgi:hypothetical protein